MISIEQQDKNKGVRIYFDGLEDGLVAINHTSPEYDEDRYTGEIKGQTLATDYLLSEVLNRLPNDRQAFKWPQYQNIKTVVSELTNSFLYYKVYD